jgi:predicted nucleic acid-binding protein
MRLTPIRVYVDTSVFGGVYDDEFAEASTAFFAAAQNVRFRLLISPLVLAELRDAPPDIRGWYDRMEPLIEFLPATDAALTLRDAYLAAGVVTPRWANDALHVAVATVHGAELIVSWNFRHMVNYERIRGYNAVNLLNGYRTLDIRTPQEVLGDEDEEI